MAVNYLVQATTIPLDSPDLPAAYEHLTDVTMTASGVPVDHKYRWWYREHLGPELAADAAGKWHLTCCQIIEEETRTNMFNRQDWDMFAGLTFHYTHCGKSRPTGDICENCHHHALADAGLTLIGPRGPVDEMLAGTWKIGDRDFRQYIQERMVE